MPKTTYTLEQDKILITDVCHRFCDHTNTQFDTFVKADGQVDELTFFTSYRRTFSIWTNKLFRDAQNNVLKNELKRFNDIIYRFCLNYIVNQLTKMNDKGSTSSDLETFAYEQFPFFFDSARRDEYQGFIITHIKYLKGACLTYNDYQVLKKLDGRLIRKTNLTTQRSKRTIEAPKANKAIEINGHQEADLVNNGKVDNTAIAHEDYKCDSYGNFNEVLDFLYDF